MNPILKFSDNFAVDESISSKQTYAFNPITGTQLNNPGSITITVQNSDNFYLPSESWLEFEGELKKSTTGNYTDTDLISFVNNGILFLFDNIKYLLSSTEIESVFNPGHVSNIIGLAKYPSSYEKGLIQCWSPDTDNNAAASNTGFEKRRNFVIKTSTPKGSFRFAVPLKHIFGFCEDYNRILYGFTHTLVLTRSSSDNNALFRKTDSALNVNVVDGKVELRNIKWMLPRITPSDVAKYDLLKVIEAKKILNVGFRMYQSITTSVPVSNQFTWRLGLRAIPEQPRYVFLAFQTDRLEKQEKNNATYDNCNLISAHILLNNDRYPLNDFEIDFAKNHYDHLYREFSSFIEKFYGIDDSVVSTSVNPLTYKSLFPIILFDVSKQSERLKSGVTDITLHCRFKANVDASTIAHVVLISDRKIRFASNGEKMSVLF